MDSDHNKSKEQNVPEDMLEEHEAKLLLEKERALATAAKLRALQQGSTSSAACDDYPARPSNTSAAMHSEDKRSQKERMLAGDLYYAFDDELLQERQKAKAILAKYNSLHQVHSNTLQL